jgi:glycosyltransferase involved in cell wall biosynthesis
MSCHLTIGIPVRNEEESIGKCLRAVLASDLPMQTEIIICDNGSTDKSMEFVRTFGDERIRIVQETSLGKVFAMNKIIEQSRSEHIIFCDADVLPRKDTFIQIRKRLVGSDLHAVGINLIDVSKDWFFKWWYRQMAKIEKDELANNCMGGCFGIQKGRFGKFPPVLSTDFYMSAYYHYGNGKCVRSDDIHAFYKRASTFKDVLMKKIRNRLKYLQIKMRFTDLAGFQYEPPVDYNRLAKNLSPATFATFLLYAFFEAVAFAVGTTVFLVKFKHIGYSWRKARSTKLQDVDPAALPDVLDA